MATDAWLSGLVTREEARALGWSDRQIDRRLASGAWTAERRGILRASREPTCDDFAEVRAAVMALRGRDVVVSHTSAARLWCLPRPLGGWGPVTLTATNGPTRRRSGSRILVASLDDGQLARCRELTLTSPARTVADCLRWLAECDGLAIADAALHRPLLTHEALSTAVQAQRGWPGSRRALAVLELVDGRRETPLESWSAWAFASWDVPAPEWQVDILDDAGVFLGRADTWWADGVVGEADGRAKYALAAAERGGVTAGSLADVLHGERRREQAMRTAGADVVRWEARDVLVPDRADELARHLMNALTQARRFSRFCGRAIAR